jgi:hypothetical protein
MAVGHLGHGNKQNHLLKIRTEKQQLWQQKQQDVFFGKLGKGVICQRHRQQEEKEEK